MCFIEISKCANLSSHLVNRELFCQYVRFLFLLVPKLDGRYMDVLLCRINRMENSLIPMLLLAVPILRSGIFSGFVRMSTRECFWSDCIVVLSLPSCYSECPVQLSLVVTILSRSLAKCAQPGNSVIIFIALKISSFPSVQFQSIFFSIVVSFGRFFLKAWVRNLQNLVLL